MFPVNTVVFLALTLSMLIGAEETGRWKVVGVAVGSIIVQAAVRELVPGLLGGAISAFTAAIFVGMALISWCEIERRFALKTVGAYFGCSMVVSLFSAALNASPA